MLETLQVRNRKRLKSPCINASGCAVMRSATRFCLQLRGRCSLSPLDYLCLWKIGAVIAFLLREAERGL